MVNTIESNSKKIIKLRDIVKDFVKFTYEFIDSLDLYSRDSNTLKELNKILDKIEKIK